MHKTWRGKFFLVRLFTKKRRDRYGEKNSLKPDYNKYYYTASIIKRYALSSVRFLGGFSGAKMWAFVGVV